MPIQVIIELLAKPGRREELKSLIERARAGFILRPGRRVEAELERVQAAELLSDPATFTILLYTPTSSNGAAH